MPDDATTSTTTGATDSTSDSGAGDAAQTGVVGSIGGTQGDGESDSAQTNPGNPGASPNEPAQAPASTPDFRSKIADAYLASQLARPQGFQADYFASDAPKGGAPAQQQQGEAPLPFAAQLESLEQAFEEIGEGFGGKAGKPMREALTALHGAFQAQLKAEREEFTKQLAPIQEAMRSQAEASANVALDDFAAKANATDLLGGPTNRNIANRQHVARVFVDLKRAMPQMPDEDLLATAADVVRRQVRMPAPGAKPGGTNGVQHNAQARNSVINRGAAAARNSTTAGKGGEAEEVALLKQALNI